MGDAGPGHAGRSKCSRRRRCLGLVESQYLLKSARVTLSAVQFGPKMGDFAPDRYERSARPTDEDALRRRASLPTPWNKSSPGCRWAGRAQGGASGAAVTLPGPAETLRQLSFVASVIGSHRALRAPAASASSQQV